jgi:Skp family chaperone for outer membrane proteins
MNKTFSVISSVFVLALFSFSALAQVPGPKIGLIQTDAFYDEKAGITKLVSANKQLDSEFAPRIKELQDGNARLQAIAKELENMRKLPANVFNQATYNAKQEEGTALQRQLEFKKAEVESALTKRRDALMGPINQDIGKGITEFSKKNGYGAVFDVSKLAETGVLLFLADAANVTKEFIVFYNARPATTATAATPR